MVTFFLFLSKYRTPLMIGWLAALLAWESAAPFFGFFRQRGKDRLVHGIRNMLVGAPSALLPALGFIGLLAAIVAWTETHRFWLLNLLPLPAWAHALFALLILDVFTYFWHRANHRVPFL